MFLHCIPFIKKRPDIINHTYICNIFEDFSYGLCPKGIQLITQTNNNKNMLLCVSRKYQFSVENRPTLNEEDVEYCDELINQVVKLLQENNLLNNKDALFSKEIEMYSKTRPVYKSWTEIRKKSIRDLLIQEYIIELSNRYNLHDLQMIKIYNFINMAFLLNLIQKNDILLEDEKITNIKYIHTTEDKILLDMKIFETDAYISSDDDY